METWHFLKATAAGVLLSTFMAVALAGGVTVRIDLVSFEEGGFIVKPRSAMTLLMGFDGYPNGSGQYTYMPWAIIPAKSSMVPTADELKTWEVYGMLVGTPLLDLGPLEASSAYRFKFSAPEKTGKYKVVMGRIPVFRDAPLKTGAGYEEPFVPDTSDRSTLAAALTQTEDGINVVTEFIVASEAVVDGLQDERPSLDLKMNGQIPSAVNTPGGLQPNPLEFSWTVGSKFKKDLKKVVYRYRMEFDDDDWGAWTTLRQVRYPFLHKGTHKFSVQAKYVDGPISLESFPAMYQFTLPKAHISEPTEETLTKGLAGSLSDSGSSIAFNEVYAKSRALLVGTWRFDDARFPQFDASKISADLAAMEAALKRNGFEVTVLKRERVRREDITTALDELIDAAGRDDRLFIYFSTHGFAHPTLPNEAYLATSDCKYATPTTRCMRLNDLRLQADLALDGKQVRQVLFAVDSCFAGLGVAMKSVGVPEDLTRLAVPRGAFMLTAGMENQLAQIDPDFGMSTFTHYLADGLNGDADILGKDGLITLSELFVYVQYNVAAQTKGTQIPMLGRLKGDGEMIFLPAAKQ